MGEPIQLFTKPPSSLLFLGGSGLFVVSLDCPACGKKKAASDWDRLKAKLTTILKETAFFLLPDARAVLPRSLLPKAVFDDRIALLRSDRAMPWKFVGDKAFKQGNYWIACAAYAQRLKELKVKLPSEAEVEGAEEGEEEEEEAEEVVDHGRGPDLVPEAAKLLSNRAACFVRIKDYGAAVSHARKATRLAPRWARAWSRLGQAAWDLGSEACAEAAEAYAKSVEMEPLISAVQALQAAVRQLHGPNPDAAHAAKERGNEAMRGAELGRAIACYTQAIAQLPPQVTAEADRPDEHALLRGVLFTNRSAAFCRVRNWDAAVADGREAIAAQPGLSSAHAQLGVALLGSGCHQEAYIQFARGVHLSSEHKPSIKGRNTCLKEMLVWKSSSATARYKNRFWLDLRRSKGSSRVFALSDVHFDQKCNEDWAHGIDDLAFLDDVLIVAGNVADTKVGVMRALTTLKSKFRRVFYTVGNHEMQIMTSEFARYPDSLSKLNEIFTACDDLGIDVFPAPVCEGLLVMPLLSWCSAEYDQEDPFPDPNARFNLRCVWPMDADLQLWKYMMKLNEPFLDIRGFDTVITFSHFLPRQGLPFDKTRKNAVKAVGCDMIDEQARAVKSKLHVYGHGRVRYAQMHAGVRYVSAPIGLEADWPKDHPPRLMMVHNGRSLCMQEWGRDDEPPLGYLKRLLHVGVYAMPGLREGELRKIQAVLEKLGSSSVLCSFERIGSRHLDKAGGGWVGGGICWPLGDKKEKKQHKRGNPAGCTGQGSPRDCAGQPGHDPHAGGGCGQHDCPQRLPQQRGLLLQLACRCFACPEEPLLHLGAGAGPGECQEARPHSGAARPAAEGFGQGGRGRNGQDAEGGGGHQQAARPGAAKTPPPRNPRKDKMEAAFSLSLSLSVSLFLYFSLSIFLSFSLSLSLSLSFSLSLFLSFSLSIFLSFYLSLFLSFSLSLSLSFSLSLFLSFSLSIFLSFSLSLSLSLSLS